MALHDLIPVDQQHVVFNDSRFYILKHGKSFAERTLTKERVKTLGITIHDMSIAAAEKWSNFVFYIHSVATTDSQSFVDARVYKQILANTGILETQYLSVQNRGETIRVKIPNEAEVMTFSYPPPHALAGADYYRQQMDDDDDDEPRPAAALRAPPRPAASAYRNVVHRFLQDVQTCGDAPQLVKQMAHMFAVKNEKASMKNWPFTIAKAKDISLQGFRDAASKLSEEELPELYARMASVVCAMDILLHSEPVKIEAPPPAKKQKTTMCNNDF